MFNSTPNRRRRVLFGLVAACLSASVIGGSWAAVTAQVTQEGNSISYEATLDPQFVDGSGLINAELTPGTPNQKFVVTMTNNGTLAGQPTYWVHDVDLDKFSDAVLDETQVIVRRGVNDYGGYITLRTFLTSAFVSTNPNTFIKNGQEFTLHFEFVPPSDTSNWTQEDLGLFDQEFPSTLHLTLANNGTSDLATYAKANGVGVYGDVYAIPVGDVEAAAAGELTAETGD